MSRWLKYLLAILAAVAGLAALMVFGKNLMGPGKSLKKEFKRIDAEAEAKKAKATGNHKEAVQKIKERYKEEMDELSEFQRAQARRLDDDPDALAQWLSSL